MKETYAVTGMTCSACAIHIQKSVAKIDGVSEVSVNLMDNSMIVQWKDDKRPVTETVIKAVRSAGYGATVSDSLSSARSTTETSVVFADELRSMKQRLIVSLVAGLSVVYLAMGHMFGWPLPAIFHQQRHAMLFALTQFILSIPIFIVNGRVFARGFQALFKRSPTMDSLIAVGSASAMLYGMFALFKIAIAMGDGDLTTVNHYAMDLYFESAAMILTLVLLGKYLELRAKRKTSAALAKLMDLSPKTATRIKDGMETEVPIEEIVVGDIIAVRPGQRIAVDGTVVSGYSAVDQSALTGESLPVDKTIGDTLMSASINTSGYLTFRADRVGQDTTLAQIIKLVQQSGATRAPIAQIADKISAVFVPIVIAIALGAAIVWLALGYPFEFALAIAIAVLVISCPCALGLATPAAIMVGTGKGAEYGILSTSGEALQALSTIDTVILDKTGTITTGRPAVTDMVTAGGVLEDDLLRIAASLEQSSEHPIAKALVAAAQEKHLSLTKPEEFRAQTGLGVQGVIDRKTCLIGNRALMEQHKVDLTPVEHTNRETSERGNTIVYVALDGILQGCIAVADQVKSTSADAVSELHAMGIDVIMLTGDQEHAAHAIAAQVGIRGVIASVLPDGKADAVASVRNKGNKVAMVGDGINDAPALAISDVGIAIGAGSDIAKESADIILMKNDLKDVPAAIRLGKATLRTIKQNLFWALIYNLLGIPLAAGVFFPLFGWTLSPIFAAAAMSLSSLFVVGNALRLMLFNPARNYQNKGTGTMKEKKVTNLVVKRILIEGMTCNHCSMRVQKSLNDLDSVHAVVDLATKTATVEISKDIGNDVLKKAVEQAGYEVVSIL